MSDIASYFDRISRNDLDAFDTLDAALSACCFLAACRSSVTWRITEFCQHVIALNQFPERRVLMIEMRYAREADEKLAAGRIGISGARHREHAAFVRPIVEFRFD